MSVTAGGRKSEESLLAFRPMESKFGAEWD